MGQPKETRENTPYKVKRNACSHLCVHGSVMNRSDIRGNLKKEGKHTLQGQAERLLASLRSRGDFVLNRAERLFTKEASYCIEMIREATLNQI